MADTYSSADVAAALADLSGGRALDTWRTRLNLDALEQQHQLPAGLLSGVLRRESNGDPYATSDAGAGGLFQFMPATARQYGIDPYDPEQAAPAAAKELKRLHTYFGGDLDKTLAAWNWGQGNVARQGMQRLPQETQGFLASVKGFLSPRSAAAAEAPRQGGTYTSADVEAALAALSAPAPAPATPPSPPTARSTPAEAAAYRQWAYAQAHDGVPAPTPGVPAPPGALARFAALPSIRQLPEAERQARTREFQGLRPDLQEEFLRSEEQPPGTVRATVQPSETQPSRAPADLDTALTRELAPAQQGMPGLLIGGAAGTAGRLLGQTAQRVLPWLGRAGGMLPVAGEAAGSYAGRQANVALGHEEPGTVGDVIAAAGPLVTRAVGAIAPAIVRRLPGSAGAQHEMMAERIQAVPRNLEPATPSQTLYRAVVQQGNPAIPVQDLRQTAQELLATNAQRGAATRNPRVVRVAQEIEDLAAQHPNGVPIDRLYDTMQGVGEILGQVQRTGGRGARDISRLYAGFHRALENAAQSNIPGAETLQNAIRASRQEHAVSRLGRIVGQGRGIEEQAGSGYTFVKGKRMLNEFDRLVEDDAVFRGSFTPAELAETRALFQEATRLPALPPAGGAHHGSGRAATRAAVGSMLGGPAGAAIAVSGPAVIARAMMSRPGRAMLRAALEGHGGLTPQALATLDAALREMLPQGTP